MRAGRQRSIFGAWPRRAARPTTRLGAASLILSLALAAVVSVPVSAGRPLVCLPTGQPQCVYNVVLTPHFTSASLAFDTEYAALATVTISSAAPVQAADGTWSFTTPTFGFVVTPKATHHVASFTDLQPNTDFHYLISAAKGPVGPDYQTFGTLRTLTRHARVTFNSIHVTDDSDSLSAGDLTFWFYANGWLLYLSNGTPLSYPLDASEAEINSGDTIPLPANQYSQEIAPAPDSVVLAVYGWDDDCDFYQVCTEGIGPGIPPVSSRNIGPGGSAGGSDSEADWATAGMPPVDLAGGGTNEAFTTSFSFGTEQNSLKFEVAVTLKVWYA